MNHFLRLALSLLLAGCAAASLRGGEATEERVRAAVEKGIKRLETGAGNYIKNRQCFSCHHQTVSILGLTEAHKRGFNIDATALRQQIDFTLDTFKDKLDRVRKGQSVPGGNTMAAYALFTLDRAGHKPDATTAALVEYLLGRQKKDGSWPALTSRPPSEGSAFINTALALRTLRTYGPADKDADAAELRQRIDTAFSKGRDWLRDSKPKDTEDRVGRLLGLVFGDAEAKDRDAARDELLEAQRDDGSWTQLPDRDGDAYATATVLLSLRQAGVAATDKAYQRGVRWLLDRQRDDGAWIVTTRSRPVQVFFDNGDPGDKSQFISFMATGWAVLALLETCPVR
jgi:N-acyl-D-amino-acid deacylase